MRTTIRRGALSALLLLSTPLAATLTTTPAAAQQDKITELARAKFVDGVAAMNAKKYAEARDLFLQAYAMKRHPAVLLNLGIAEIRTGDPDVGANHLQQFLREFDQAKPEQRDTANKEIAAAKKTSAYVIAIVDTDGATVMVDGQVVGQSPLTEPYFVKAGDHDVEARFNGRATRIKVQAKVGAMAAAQLNLKTGATEAVPMPAASEEPEEKPRKKEKEREPEKSEEPEQPPKQDEPNRWTNDMPPPDNGPYMNPGYNTPPAFGNEAPKTDAVERPAFVDWLKQKPAAIGVLSVGGGLGLLGTIGFGAGAASAKSAATDVTNAIVAQTHSPSSSAGVLPASYYDAAGNPIPCGKLDDPSTSHPYYRDACNQLRDNIKAHDTDIALMATSLALMGASAVGTYVWYYVDSGKKADASGATPSSPSQDGAPRAFLTLTPILSTHQQGLGIVGTF